ncbi:MAG: hypothetical protein V7752_18320 [Halopseudomonas sp.]
MNKNTAAPTDKEQPQSPVKSRRSFLQKASVGAAITTLPAASVWGGTCSDSAASSNSGSHVHTDCTFPLLSGGRSPGNWKNFEDNIHDTFTAVGAVKDDSPPNANASQGNSSCSYAEYQAFKDCYIAQINIVMGHTITTFSTPTFPGITFTVADGLSSNGTGMSNIKFHLAAAYLNGYFGFYDGQLYNAAEIIEQIWAFYVIQTESNNTVNITDFDMGYTDGSTNFTFDLACPVPVCSN